MKLRHSVTIQITAKHEIPETQFHGLTEKATKRLSNLSPSGFPIAILPFCIRLLERMSLKLSPSR
jgi:hypothetical protein